MDGAERNEHADELPKRQSVETIYNLVERRYRARPRADLPAKLFQQSIPKNPETDHVNLARKISRLLNGAVELVGVIVHYDQQTI